MIDPTIYKSPTEVKQRTPNVKIPFDKLEPGLSVFLHFTECREDSLRSLISTQNSKTETKKFKFIKHKEKEYYEVACTFPVEAKAFVEERMMVESSPEAKATVVKDLDGKRKYPFAEVPEGQSFIVPFIGNEVLLEKSLRVACCVQTKKLDKRFVLVKHAAHKMFEIYHKPKANVAFFTPSPEAIQKGGEV